MTGICRQCESRKDSRGFKLTDFYDVPLCVRRCEHVIGQSHNRRGADCTLASWDGRRGR